MARTAFIIFVVCFIATALGLHPPSIHAKNRAELVDIQLGRSKGNLNVSFQIRDCFTPEMEEAIRSGVETTFRILVIVEKPGIPLIIPVPVFKSRLIDVAIEHTIKFDRLKNEFQVYLPEHPDKILTTQDLEEAKRWMSSVTEMPVIPLGRLQNDRTYHLLLKAELSKVDLPPFFRYIFFFVSLWDFDTDWHKVTFTI